MALKTTDKGKSSSRQDLSGQVPHFEQNWALFLDVDGTLLELMPHPDQVMVSRDLLDILAELRTQTNGAIALISGRPLDDLDNLFKPLRFSLAGQHGLERRDNNGVIHQHPVPDDQFTRVKQILKKFAQDHAGIYCEDKMSSIAVHYRQSPQHRAELEKTIEKCMPGIAADFHLQSGKMVFEIKPRGKDKGTAIEEFMQEPPFADRMPVFIGDDVTDEDGFDTVNRLGGHSIKVGNGNTVAQWHLGDSITVLDWLASYSDYLRQINAGE